MARKAKARRATKPRLGRDVGKRRKSDIDTLSREMMREESASARSTKRRLADAGPERAPLNLVTGASGRLGSFLLGALLAKKERVRVLQRRGAPASYPKGVEIAYGELADRAALEKAVDGVDRVFHLAALVSHSASPEALLEVNYKGTRNLMDACRARAFSLSRFVYISSIAVYGKSIETLPATEETPLNPSDWYGKSKAMAEEVVMQYAERIPVVVIRPAVIYGEGFDEAYLPMLSALEKGKMPLIGKGNNVIPFVHVKDVVRGILLASASENAPGNAYILASDERKTQREIYAIACKHLGVSPPNGSSPAWLVKLKLRLANLSAALSGKKPKLLEEHIDTISANRYYSIDKARVDLGYRPQVRLEEGIGEMVEYYRSSKGGKL